MTRWPDLPPGVEDLPIQALLRRLLISYPDDVQVGLCQVQRAIQARPIPFEFSMLEIEFPEEAWVEARGQTAYLQYRYLEGSGRYLMYGARCRIPDSQKAVDAAFAYLGASARRDSVPGGSDVAAFSSTSSEWTIQPGLERRTGVTGWQGTLAGIDGDPNNPKCHGEGSGGPDDPIQCDAFGDAVPCHSAQTYDEIRLS
jgi:hypothetical protein